MGLSKRATAAGVVAMLVVALGGGSAFVGSSAASSHNAQPPMPVDVKNQSLPIAGSVSVLNLPGVQRVREVAHPAHQAVQSTISIDDWSKTFDGRTASFAIEDVPEDKILVIQQVSVHAKVPVGQHVLAYIIGQGSQGYGEQMIPLTRQGTFSGLDNWVGTEAMTIYAAAPNPGSIKVLRNSTAGDAGPSHAVQVSYIGYLVDKAT